ncbi:MAG: tetratricopeptide repeat protein [Candidatus Riflebacteria bacterium]|nr:tetratricopeptide repeat protein [Candidatus Riflebacteria bacterium]
MSEIVEQKIQEICTETANRLAPLVGSNASLPVQAQVVRILAKTHVPAVTDKVVAFFQAHPNLEESILAAAELPAETAVPLLTTQLRTRFAENRDIIAEQLGRFKTPTTFETLRELLDDEDRHVRYQAAQSLFSQGGREAALALCKYISDPDEWISMTILKMLCRLKEHESIPFLAEQFTKDTDIRRKAQMVSFLSLFRSVTLVNIFDEGLKGKDARLKANSIEAIGDLELPQREIKQRIQPFLQDPNNRIRANAILALARSEPETIRPEIVQMVASSDVQLRRSAAYILGQISPAGNEELVEKLIVDASQDVRKRMVLSLKPFPAEFVQRQLERTATDQSKWIRKFSIEQAALFPAFPKAIVIKQLRAETAYPNLVACMDFFGKHPDEEAARLIRQRVKDKRDQVVSGVIRAIGAMYGIKGLQAIAPQVNYKDPKILKGFVVTHFSLGGLDILPSILEKTVQVKGSASDNPYLASIEGCIELLQQKAKMPKELLAELSRLPPIPEPVPEPVPVVHAPPPVTVPASRPHAIPTPAAGGAMPAIPPIPPIPGLEEGLPPAPAAAATGQPAEPRPKAKAKPKIPAEFQAGLKFYNLGKYAKARKAFETALEAHPKLVKACLYLGLICYEDKDYERAREHLLRFLGKEPGHKKATSILVKILKNLREWPTLVGTLEGILGPDFTCEEGNLRLAKELGSAYIFCRNFSQAKVVLEKVFRVDPTDSQSNYHLAMSCFHLKEFTKAESLLRDILRQVPKGDRLHMMAESLMDKIRQTLTTGLGATEPRQPEPRPAESLHETPAAPEPRPEAPPPLDLGDDLGGTMGSAAGAEKPFLDLNELDVDVLQEDGKTPESPAPEPLDLGPSLFEPIPGPPGAPSDEGPSLTFLGDLPPASGEDEETPSITMPGTLDDLPPAPKKPLVSPIPVRPKGPPKKPDDDPPDGQGNNGGGFKLPSL